MALAFYTSDDWLLFLQGSEDSNPPSPDQYPGQREPTINGGMPSLDTKTSGDSPSTINSKNSLDVKTAEMVQHLLMMNGHHDNKMAALQSFQNLQNLATGLQNLNSVSSLVAGLQGLTGESGLDEMEHYKRMVPPGKFASFATQNGAGHRVPIWLYSNNFLAHLLEKWLCL